MCFGGCRKPLPGLRCELLSSQVSASRAGCLPSGHRGQFPTETLPEWDQAACLLFLSSFPRLPDFETHPAAAFSRSGPFFLEYCSVLSANCGVALFNRTEGP